MCFVFNQKQTHKPYTVTFDLTDPAAIAAAAAEILQCFGYVDVLINNAGVSYRGAISDTLVDVDRKVMEINYFGPVALTKGRHLGKRCEHKLLASLLFDETLPVSVHFALCSRCGH